MKPHELLEQAARRLEAGQPKEAQRACRKALQARPDLVEAHLVMAEIHRIGGDVDKARASATRALRLAGASEPAPRVLADLGHVLASLERPDEAASSYRRALAVEPALADAREGLLRVLRAQRRFAEAEALAREGVAAHPGAAAFSAELGAALWWQGRNDDALAAFALLDGPGADRTSPAYRAGKLSQASALLALGRWREGWEAFRARPTRAAWRARFPRLAEDPAALARPCRVLVIGEQGLGDEVFFLRFAPRLREQGHTLYGRFEERLLPLLRTRQDLFDALLAHDDPTPLDADITLVSGDLPLAAREETAPPLALAVDDARRAAFEARLRAFGPPPYVGVTWRGGTLPDERGAQGALYLVKEVPLEPLGRALRATRATVVSLQRRPSRDEQERLAAALGRPVLDLSAVNDDLRDALALLSLLDDYVCASNTNTHLRSACPGKGARVLVPAAPEWRWGLRDARSPWFPGFMIYRRAPDGDWDGALDRLAADLAKDLAAKQH